MRNLRNNFVVVEIEVPADVRPGPEISQRTTPLSLEDALQGSRMARFGVPQGIYIPIHIDEGHQYIVRVWHGPDATSQDLEIADGMVGSMRSDFAKPDALWVAETPHKRGQAFVAHDVLCLAGGDSIPSPVEQAPTKDAERQQ